MLMKSSAVAFQVTPLGYSGVVVPDVDMAIVPRVLLSPGTAGHWRKALQLGILGGCGSRIAQRGLVVLDQLYTFDTAGSPAVPNCTMCSLGELTTLKKKLLS